MEHKKGVQIYKHSRNYMGGRLTRTYHFVQKAAIHGVFLPDLIINSEWLGNGEK
jgi:hypothetical protein